MGRAKAHIGTSGWRYRAWRGDFYPEEIPQRAWLPYLADRLDAVEINGTFYSLPKPDTVNDWMDEVPSDFRFSFKMWRGVTHYRKLKHPEDLMRRFFRSIGPTSSKHRGPLLVQLPPNWGADPERLDAFLENVKDLTMPERWKVAVEFRDTGWLQDDVYDVVEDHHAAVCVHDMKGSENDEPGDGGAFVYVRRHGPKGDYTGRYSKTAVEADAKRIDAWRDDGRTVYVYYNNDADGYAPHDAQRLREAVA